MLKELKELEIRKLNGLPDNQEKIQYINDCKTIVELGYNLQSAIKELENNGIPVILNEDDKQIISNDHVQFNSLDDFVAVHKDEFLPENSKILTPTDAGAIIEDYFIVDGIKYDYNYKYQRNSVHFALNGEVDEIGSAGATWDKFPYITIMPLRDLPIGELGQYSLGDTFTDGSVEINNRAWILLPKGKKEELLSNNPDIKANILEYTGNPKGYGNAILSMLGYKYEKQDSHSALWNSREENDLAIDFFKNNYSKKWGIRHFDTDSKKIDDRITSRNKALAILNKLVEEEIITENSADEKKVKEIKKYLSDCAKDFTNDEIEFIGENGFKVTDTIKEKLEELDESQLVEKDTLKIDLLINHWLEDVKDQISLNKIKNIEVDSKIKEAVELGKIENLERKDVNNKIEKILLDNNIEYSKYDTKNFFAMKTKIKNNSELYETLIKNGYKIVYPAKLSEYGIDNTIKSDFKDKLMKITDNAMISEMKKNRLLKQQAGEIKYFEKKENDMTTSDALIVDGNSIEPTAELLDLITRHYGKMIDYAKSKKAISRPGENSEFSNPLFCQEKENAILLDNELLEQDQLGMYMTLRDFGFDFDIEKLDISKYYTPEFIEKYGKKILTVANFKNIKGQSLKQINMNKRELSIKEATKNALKSGITAEEVKNTEEIEKKEHEKGEEAYDK